MQTAWRDRLKNLITGLKVGSDLAAYRNAYQDALRSAARSGLAAEDISLLDRSRECAERWAHPKAGADSSDWAFWLSLYKSRARISDEIVLAMLRRLPPASVPRADCLDFALTEGTPAAIDILLTRKLIARGDVLRSAKQRPREFYSSGLLDVSIRRRLRIPPDVWQYCGEPRPRGLMPGDQAVVTAYSNDKSPSSNKGFVQLLTGLQSDRGRILRTLMADNESTERLVQYLVSSYWRQKKPKGAAYSDAVGVMAALIAVSREAAQELGAVRRVASFVLATARIIGATSDGTMFADALDNPQNPDEASAGALLLRALRDMDSQLGAGDTLAVVGPVQELYEAVGEYIRSLSEGAEGGSSGASSAQLERYLAVRDMVQGLVSVLDSPVNDTGLRDALEAALFNAGVRLIGTPGEEVVFDPRVHQVTEGGVVPGAKVLVVEPGRVLGEESAGVVIRPVKVKGFKDS